LSIGSITPNSAVPAVPNMATVSSVILFQHRKDQSKGRIYFCVNQRNV
jgi:hypothetical protein